MTLIAEGKVIIEVGLNETAPKSANPHVPYGPEEVAEDAVRVAEAGAALVHFHARYDDGSQAKTDDDVYRRAMELIAQRSDVITWPTAFPLGPRPTSAEELPHHWALLDDPPQGAPLRIGAFDAWRIGRRPWWDQATRTLKPADREGFGPRDAEYQGSEALREMLRRGLLPTICCYELGDVRWARHAALAGLLPQPVRLEVLLWHDWIYGPSATVAGIDAYLSEWTDEVDGELTVVPYGMPDRESYAALLHHSLDRGVNVRVGIGDCPTALPDATNAELVEWAVKLSADHGLTPATAAEVRERLKI